MARDFDGTNDNISFGSDASIDDFTTMSFAAWVNVDALSDGELFGGKPAAGTAWGFILGTAADADSLTLNRQFVTTNGIWRGGTNFTGPTGRKHLCVTHDGTTADPAIYVDGVAETITVQQAPAGALSADAANNLLIGETGSGVQDLDGQMENVCYDNIVWDSATVNRARWWGRPGGALEVYHPFWTTKLTNEGTATADGTATGTTVVNNLITPVVIPGTAMMGMGVGW